MPTKQGRYATPDEFFRYARDAWREFDLRWGVGEIGTEAQDGTCSEQAWEPYGAKFAAWTRAITAAAADPARLGPSYAGPLHEVVGRPRRRRQRPEPRPGAGGPGRLPRSDPAGVVVGQSLR